MTQTAEYTQEHLQVSGGDRIGLQHYPRPADESAPVVVVWPAMGTPARYYRYFATELAARGFGVLVVDLRGNGSSTPRASRSSRYGYADLADDVGAVLDLPSLKGRRVFLVGHSLGGQACVLHLARGADPRVEGLALVAVGLPYFRSYGRRRALGVLAFTQWVAGASALLRFWPGWGFGGRQARGVMRDWGFTARRGRFPRIGGADMEQKLAQVRTPVLAVSVDNDQFTPASTMDHLVAKLRSAPVERVHYTTSEANGPLDHMIWVRAAGPLADRIAHFAGLDEQGGGAR